MGFMDQFNQQAQISQLAQRIDAIRTASGGDPSALIDYLSRNNRSFAGFLQSVKGKTPLQAFQEHGLDFNRFSGLL